MKLFWHRVSAFGASRSPTTDETPLAMHPAIGQKGRATGSPAQGQLERFFEPDKGRGPRAQCGLDWRGLGFRWCCLRLWNGAAQSMLLECERWRVFSLLDVFVRVRVRAAFSTSSRLHRAAAADFNERLVVC